MGIVNVVGLDGLVLGLSEEEDVVLEGELTIDELTIADVVGDWDTVGVVLVVAGGVVLGLSEREEGLGEGM